MAALDHQNTPAEKQISCARATCNVSLVFIGILFLAYLVSLFG